MREERAEAGATSISGFPGKCEKDDTEHGGGGGAGGEVSVGWRAGGEEALPAPGAAPPGGSLEEKGLNCGVQCRERQGELRWASHRPPSPSPQVSVQSSRAEQMATVTANTKSMTRGG